MQTPPWGRAAFVASLLAAMLAITGHATAAEIAPGDRNQQVRPPDATRQISPDQDAERYDPRTGTYQRGSDQETDSTRKTPANPYDKSIQPTDIPPTRDRQPR
jgi:hypothetical protein